MHPLRNFYLQYVLDNRGLKIHQMQAEFLYFAIRDLVKERRAWSVLAMFGVYLVWGKYRKEGSPR